MQYKIIEQEKSNWCVPACLQTILTNRGFNPPTQTELADFLRIKEEGFNLDLKILADLLNIFGLDVEHKNPFTMVIESDFILKESLNVYTNVCAAYDQEILKSNGTHCNQKPIKHFSILEVYTPQKDFIRLIDPAEKIIETNLTNLNSAMKAQDDPRYGFYIIT